MLHRHAKRLVSARRRVQLYEYIYQKTNDIAEKEKENSIYEEKEAAVMKAICRSTGHRSPRRNENEEGMNAFSRHMRRDHIYVFHL